VGKGRERIDTGLRLEDHAAAIAAIATVGTAEGDIFLATKTGAATTAVARRHFDMHAVDEHGLRPAFRSASS
jgi:hypothetical protein